MIPFHMHGKVIVPPLGSGAAETLKATAERLTHLLESADASEVYVDGSRVHFRNAIYRETERYNVLAPFGSGRFDIKAGSDGATVRYRLNAMRVFGVMLLVFGLFFGMFLAAASGDVKLALENLGQGFGGFLLVICVLIYLVSWVRVHVWLDLGLESVADLRGS